MLGRTTLNADIRLEHASCFGWNARGVIGQRVARAELVAGEGVEGDAGDDRVDEEEKT